MLSPRKTIAKLRVRAAGKGPEAEIARSALKSLEARYPDEAALADADEEPVAQREYPVKGRHEATLFAHLCGYLGLEGLQYKKGHTPRGRSVRIARGPASVLDALPALLKALKARLAELHWGTTVGFVVGALPQPDDDSEEDDRESPQLSPEALAQAWAAMEAGRTAQPRRQLAGKVHGHG